MMQRNVHKLSKIWRQKQADNFQLSHWPAQWLRRDHLSLQIIWNLGGKTRSENCWTCRHTGLLNSYKTFKTLKRESLVKNIQTFDALKCRSKSCLHASLVEVKMKKAQTFKELEKFCTSIFPLQKNIKISSASFPFSPFSHTKETWNGSLK